MLCAYREAEEDADEDCLVALEVARGEGAAARKRPETPTDPKKRLLRRRISSTSGDRCVSKNDYD